jgi:hypothetical protein
VGGARLGWALRFERQRSDIPDIPTHKTKTQKTKYFPMGLSPYGGTSGLPEARGEVARAVSTGG